MFSYLQNQGASNELATLVVTLAEAIKEISEVIVKTSTGKIGSKNVFGEEQAAMDVRAEEVLQDHLRRCSFVAALGSEELDGLQPVFADGKYTVVYDPLDGSSLLDVNFAVGTIVGVYEGRELVGRKGRDQVAALYSIYGPRTTLVLTVGHGVHEFTLDAGVWNVTGVDLRLDGGKSKYFAPGNLRMAKEREDYFKLVTELILEQYTLRYSGGMVADINHTLKKGHGIFMYPGGPGQPDGKIRLLFESNPMAFIMEQAGGAASNGEMDILDMEIRESDQQSPIFIGTKEEVARCKSSLKHWS